jgi:hypothetical protein
MLSSSKIIIFNYYFLLPELTGSWILKGKVYPRTGHEGPDGEQRYSSTLSLTLAQDGGGWSTPCPGCFTPGKQTQYTVYRRLGGPLDWSGWMRKVSPPLGFSPQTIQPIVSHCTDCAILAHAGLWQETILYLPFVCDELCALNNLGWPLFTEFSYIVSSAGV